MYTPNHYREIRNEQIFDVLRRYSFATVITKNNDEPWVSHLPLLLQEDGESEALIGHCARANPQWRHFAEGQKVTAIFHGPHAYISPAWYAENPENVPTWNYVAVHVKGTAQIISGSNETLKLMNILVSHFEKRYGTNWQLPSPPNPELIKLAQSIVAFRIQIQEITAKFKLSQKQNSTDRQTVMEQLPQFAGSDGLSIADFMRQIST